MENTEKLWGREKISKQQMIEDLKRVAELLKAETVTVYEYMEHGKYSDSPYIIAFGGWGNAQISAGLKQHKRAKFVSNEELLNDLIRVSKELKVDYVAIAMYMAHGKYTISIYTNRFGKWKDANRKAGLYK